MKQAILGLHSSRGSTSQVNRTSTGVHGPQSHLRTSAVGSASLQAAHRPKPTIFVSGKLLIYTIKGRERLLVILQFSLLHTLKVKCMYFNILLATDERLDESSSQLFNMQLTQLHTLLVLGKMGVTHRQRFCTVFLHCHVHFHSQRMKALLKDGSYCE